MEDIYNKKRVIYCISEFILNKFASEKLKTKTPNRKSFKVNAWKVCVCELDDPVFIYTNYQNKPETKLKNNHFYLNNQ